MTRSKFKLGQKLLAFNGLRITMRTLKRIDYHLHLTKKVLLRTINLKKLLMRYRTYNSKIKD